MLLRGLARGLLSSQVESHIAGIEAAVAARGKQLLLGVRRLDRIDIEVDHGFHQLVKVADDVFELLFKQYGKFLGEGDADLFANLVFETSKSVLKNNAVNLPAQLANILSDNCKIATDSTKPWASYLQESASSGGGGGAGYALNQLSAGLPVIPAGLEVDLADYPGADRLPGAIKSALVDCLGSNHSSVEISSDEGGGAPAVVAGDVRPRLSAGTGLTDVTEMFLGLAKDDDERRDLPSLNLHLKLLPGVNSLTVFLTAADTTKDQQLPLWKSNYGEEASLCVDRVLPIYLEESIFKSAAPRSKATAAVYKWGELSLAATKEELAFLLDTEGFQDALAKKGEDLLPQVACVLEMMINFDPQGYDSFLRHAIASQGAETEPNPEIQRWLDNWRTHLSKGAAGYWLIKTAAKNASVSKLVSLDWLFFRDSVGYFDLLATYSAGVMADVPFAHLTEILTSWTNATSKRAASSGLLQALRMYLSDDVLAAVCAKLILELPKTFDWKVLPDDIKYKALTSILKEETQQAELAILSLPSSMQVFEAVRTKRPDLFVSLIKQHIDSNPQAVYKILLSYHFQAFETCHAVTIPVAEVDLSFYSKIAGNFLTALQANQKQLQKEIAPLKRKYETQQADCKECEAELAEADTEAQVSASQVKLDKAYEKLELMKLGLVPHEETLRLWRRVVDYLKPDPIKQLNIEQSTFPYFVSLMVLYFKRKSISELVAQKIQVSAEGGSEKQVAQLNTAKLVDQIKGINSREEFELGLLAYKLSAAVFLAERAEVGTSSFLSLNKIPNQIPETSVHFYRGLTRSRDQGYESSQGPFTTAELSSHFGNSLVFYPVTSVVEATLSIEHAMRETFKVLGSDFSYLAALARIPAMLQSNYMPSIPPLMRGERQLAVANRHVQPKIFSRLANVVFEKYKAAPESSRELAKLLFTSGKGEVEFADFKFKQGQEALSKLAIAVAKKKRLPSESASEELKASDLAKLADGPSCASEKLSASDLAKLVDDLSERIATNLVDCGFIQAQVSRERTTIYEGEDEALQSFGGARAAIYEDDERAPLLSDSQDTTQVDGLSGSEIGPHIKIAAFQLLVDIICGISQRFSDYFERLEDIEKSFFSRLSLEIYVDKGQIKLALDPALVARLNQHNHSLDGLRVVTLNKVRAEGISPKPNSKLPELIKENLDGIVTGLSCQRELGAQWVSLVMSYYSTILDSANLLTLTLRPERIYVTNSLLVYLEEGEIFIDPPLMITVLLAGLSQHNLIPPEYSFMVEYAEKCGKAFSKNVESFFATDELDPALLQEIGSFFAISELSAEAKIYMLRQICTALVTKKKIDQLVAAEENKYKQIYQLMLDVAGDDRRFSADSGLSDLAETVGALKGLNSIVSNQHTVFAAWTTLAELGEDHGYAKSFGEAKDVCAIVDFQRELEFVQHCERTLNTGENLVHWSAYIGKMTDVAKQLESKLKSLLEQKSARPMCPRTIVAVVVGLIQVCQVVDLALYPDSDLRSPLNEYTDMWAIIENLANIFAQHLIAPPEKEALISRLGIYTSQRAAGPQMAILVYALSLQQEGSKFLLVDQSKALTKSGGAHRIMVTAAGMAQKLIATKKDEVNKSQLSETLMLTDPINYYDPTFMLLQMAAGAIYLVYPQGEGFAAKLDASPPDKQFHDDLSDFLRNTARPLASLISTGRLDTRADASLSSLGDSLTKGLASGLMRKTFTGDLSILKLGETAQVEIKQKERGFFDCKDYQGGSLRDRWQSLYQLYSLYRDKMVEAGSNPLDYFSEWITVYLSIVSHPWVNQEVITLSHMQTFWNILKPAINFLFATNSSDCSHVTGERCLILIKALQDLLKGRFIRLSTRESYDAAVGESNKLFNYKPLEFKYDGFNFDALISDVTGSDQFVEKNYKKLNELIDLLAYLTTKTGYSHEDFAPSNDALKFLKVVHTTLSDYKSQLCIKDTHEVEMCEFAGAKSLPVHGAAFDELDASRIAEPRMRTVGFFLDEGRTRGQGDESGGATARPRSDHVASTGSGAPNPSEVGESNGSNPDGWLEFGYDGSGL